MANFVANCKISGPARTAAKADVDFNGLQWSYTIGLMFPPQAAAATVPVILPNQPKMYIPGSA